MVSSYLLEEMRRAGATKAFILLRSGKWDIPKYYADGGAIGMDLAYLVTNVTHGPAYTVDLAHPFVSDCRVAFGFPDMLLHPPDFMLHVAQRQLETGPDICLGLFPAPVPEQDEMIVLDGTGVKELVFFPEETDLVYTWNAAVWTPVFTEFLHQHLVAVELGVASGAERREVKVGYVIQAAVEAGLSVETITFADGQCIDVGTPANLARAAGALSRGESPFSLPEP